MSKNSLAQNRPAHHSSDGFRNPFPTFEERGFSDLFKWIVIDRINGERPVKPENYNFPFVENDGKFVRQNKTEFTITWIGHSTLLIQLDGMNILTDPIWSDRCSPVQFAGPSRHVPPGIAFENLPPIDVVIISHNHYDHLDRLTIENLGNRPLYLVPLGIGSFLNDLGITHFEEFDWWDTITINGAIFNCVPAQHFSNRTFFDRNKTLWCGWVIQGKSRSVYFAGDTGYFPVFKELPVRFGEIDIVALPIGAYLPRWFMAPIHMSPEEAIQAYIDLKAKIFVPIHWGTFELADEPLDNPPKVLREEIQKRNLDETKIWLLKHGETRVYQYSDIARIPQIEEKAF